MRATFVMGTVLLALALGVGAALSDSRLLAAIVTIGMAPLIWLTSRLIERTGHDLSHFGAPYPYRWMHEPGQTAMSATARGAPIMNAAAPGASFGTHHRPLESLEAPKAD